MKHFKNVITILGGISMIFVIFFGVNLATSVKNVKAVFNLPEEVESLQDVDSELLFDVHELQHASELMWELARLMTDDIDTLLYTVVVNGVPYDVDIRENAEGVELAFVFKQYVVYPLMYSPADKRKYIVIHDYHTGNSENYYIYELN